ncbi:MAG TPA: hypothetical protein VHK88_10730 [Aquihabitans sp.]|jgi:hypothetical protein|nr:hypothetical protein [Aquihabitans sp.]
MTGLAVAVVVLVLVAGAVFASKRVKHPEQTASHGEADVSSTSERFYRGVDRPAGPDAEDPIGPTRLDRPPGDADDALRPSSPPDQP